MNRLHIAQIAHEVNRAYCASQGDASQPAWADAPEWQKVSALAGVDMHTANPDATPEQSHESWLAQKTADGWAYGDVKDAEKKLHPCFLPYAELPAEQKAKDYLFRGVVHAMLALPQPELVALPVVQPVADKLLDASGIGHQVLHGNLVRFIGGASWVDRLYGSKLSFEPQQVRRVPGDLAQRFLRHADMFESAAESAQASAEPGAAVIATDDTAAQLELAAKSKKEDDTTQNQLQDLLDTVNTMDKDALQSFALEKFNQKVPKSLSVDNMRLRVAEFVQAYGV